jgi:hypothetical protein
MTHSNQDDASAATGFSETPKTQLWLATAGVLAIRMIAGGYLLGNGLDSRLFLDRRA